MGAPTRSGRRFGLPAGWGATLALAVAACTPADAARVGAPAPAFTATTLAGDSVSLASYRGAPVLLNLWATWCEPCRRETPYLQALQERYRAQGLVVVGVSVDPRDALTDVRRFVDEFGVSYPVLADPEMRALERFDPPGLPATFLLDREGLVRRVISGPVEPGDVGFHDALRSLVP